MSKRDKDVLAQTVYHEARGEPEKGWKGVAHVIMNRAKLNISYWGGSSVYNVCMHPGMFECWNSGRNYNIDHQQTYNKIKLITDQIYDGSDRHDPTGGADHYNNPAKEYPPPPWTEKCNEIVRIGNHQFYKTKREFM